MEWNSFRRVLSGGFHSYGADFVAIALRKVQETTIAENNISSRCPNVVTSRLVQTKLQNVIFFDIFLFQSNTIRFIVDQTEFSTFKPTTPRLQTPEAPESSK